MCNLIEGLQAEMNRNRELLGEYEAVGPSGAFGAHFIRTGIAEAEVAISEGDIVKNWRGMGIKKGYMGGGRCGIQRFYICEQKQASRPSCVA